MPNRTLLPSARTASTAVFQATARACSTRATVSCWQTIADSAQRSPPRVSLARGSAAAGVLAPHVPATRAPVAADRDDQRRRAPTERLVRQPAGHALVRDALAAAPPAPPIGVSDPTRQHRAAGLQLLPDDLQTEVVEPAERSQVRARDGDVRQRRGPSGGNVRTPIPKRPRATGQRHAACPYTLICEESLYRPRERLGPGLRLDLADVQHSAQALASNRRASILAGTGGASRWHGEAASASHPTEVPRHRGPTGWRLPGRSGLQVVHPRKPYERGQEEQPAQGDGHDVRQGDERYAGRSMQEPARIFR